MDNAIESNMAEENAKEPMQQDLDDSTINGNGQPENDSANELPSCSNINSGGNREMYFGFSTVEGAINTNDNSLIMEPIKRQSNDSSDSCIKKPKVNFNTTENIGGEQEPSSIESHPTERNIFTNISFLRTALNEMINEGFLEADIIIAEGISKQIYIHLQEVMAKVLLQLRIEENGEMKKELFIFELNKDLKKYDTIIKENKIKTLCAFSEHISAKNESHVLYIYKQQALLEKGITVDEKYRVALVEMLSKGLLEADIIIPDVRDAYKTNTYLHKIIDIKALLEIKTFENGRIKKIPFTLKVNTDFLKYENIVQNNSARMENFGSNAALREVKNNILLELHKHLATSANEKVTSVLKKLKNAIISEINDILITENTNVEIALEELKSKVLLNLNDEVINKVFKKNDHLKQMKILILWEIDKVTKQSRTTAANAAMSVMSSPNIVALRKRKILQSSMDNLEAPSTSVVGAACNSNNNDLIAALTAAAHLNTDVDLINVPYLNKLITTIDTLWTFTSPSVNENPFYEITLSIKKAHSDLIVAANAITKQIKKLKYYTESAQNGEVNIEKPADNSSDIIVIDD